MAELTYSLFFVLALVSAVLVVFSRHPVHGALFLILTMVALAGLFILINAQWAAVFQILVYAGAIMVLFLFVIMLLNIGRAGELPVSTRSIRRAGVVFGLALAVQAAALMARFGAEAAFPETPPPLIPIGRIALALLTRYLYAFELTSVMLLVAVIGALALAGRRSSADGPPEPQPPGGRP